MHQYFCIRAKEKSQHWVQGWGLPTLLHIIITQKALKSQCRAPLETSGSSHIGCSRGTVTLGSPGELGMQVQMPESCWWGLGERVSPVERVVEEQRWCSFLEMQPGVQLSESWGIGTPLLNFPWNGRQTLTVLCKQLAVVYFLNLHCYFRTLRDKRL